MKDVLTSVVACLDHPLQTSVTIRYKGRKIDVQTAYKALPCWDEVAVKPWDVFKSLATAENLTIKWLECQDEDCCDDPDGYQHYWDNEQTFRPDWLG